MGGTGEKAFLFHARWKAKDIMLAAPLNISPFWTIVAAKPHRKGANHVDIGLGKNRRFLAQTAV